MFFSLYFAVIVAVGLDRIDSSWRMTYFSRTVIRPDLVVFDSVADVDIDSVISIFIFAEFSTDYDEL